MAESPASALTGDDIISELIRNVDVGLFKVGHTVLLPCRFNVYLHEQDFDADPSDCTGGSSRSETGA